MMRRTASAPLAAIPIIFAVLMLSGVRAQPVDTAAQVQSQMVVGNAAVLRQRPDTERMVQRRKALEDRISTVAPTAAVVTPPADNAVVEPSPGTVQPPTPEPVQPSPAPATEDLKKGTLQYIKTSPELEQQLTSALASQTAIQSAGTAIVPLPGVLRQQTVDGVEVQLKPYVVLADNLSRDRRTGMYVGSIKVGVSEISGGAPRQLSAPVLFQVLERRLATPDRISVSQTSPPFEEIQIAVRSALGGVTVRVASQFKPDGVAVTLPLEPTVVLSTASDVIEGLGIEAVALNISVAGLADAAGRVVDVSASPSAYIAPSRLTLDANGTATTTIRSTGTGTVNITAEITGLEPGTKQLHFEPPYRTLGASALGGIVGGLIRLLFAVRQGANAKQVLLGLLGALLFGLLVFALYAVGVNVLPVQPTVTVGALLVFAVSALGAYLGTSLIKPGGAES